MKKILALVIVMVLSMVMLAGCGQQKSKKTVTIGETVVVDDIEFTVTDVSFAHKFLSHTGLNDPSGSEQVCIVYYSVKNVGKSAVIKNQIADMTLNYNDGYLFEPDEASYAMGDGYVSNLAEYDLEPLSDAFSMTKEFKVPKEVETESENSLLLNVSITGVSGKTESLIVKCR